MRRYIGFAITLITCLGAWAAEDDSSSSVYMYGDVTLLSHYVENGISQSAKTPAIQGSFWFNLGPQFRLGLWGSNTNYTGNDDRFNLRLSAEIKVDISPKSNLVISYSKSSFYNDGKRNGNITGIHLNLQDYRILHDNYSNWEGTEDSLRRFALGKTTDVFGTWKWNNEVGYNVPDIKNLENYFDLRTGLGSKWGKVFLEGALTGTSPSPQVETKSEVYFILSGKTEF